MFCLLALLSGCVASSAQEAEKRTNMRVMVMFDAAPPQANDQRLHNLLSAACDCTPQFVRIYPANALIYQIGLRAPDGFAAFAQRLKSEGRALGIREVELDERERR